MNAVNGLMAVHKFQLKIQQCAFKRIRLKTKREPEPEPESESVQA